MCRLATRRRRGLTELRPGLAVDERTIHANEAIY